MIRVDVVRFPVDLSRWIDGDRVGLAPASGDEVRLLGGTASPPSPNAYTGLERATATINPHKGPPTVSLDAPAVGLLIVFRPSTNC